MKSAQPKSIISTADRNVRRDAKEADMYNVFIFDHPPDSAQSSLLRDKKTTTKEFRDLSAKLRS